MKRTQTLLITTVMLSIALTSVFAIDFTDSKNTQLQKTSSPFPEAQAAPSGAEHNITMEAVKMPDGLYAYRMVNYLLTDSDDNQRNLVDEGVYSKDPSIPGPTLVFTEGDKVFLTLTNRACDENFVSGSAGIAENSRVGIHVHGVHYDISDDATYKRVNMSDEFSAAACDQNVEYEWDIGSGTRGTWPYHDHTFSQNEVGGEDLGLFGAIIVNPQDGKVKGFVNSGTGKIQKVRVDQINKEFVLWMVSSETLGRSVFYGMEIDNRNPTTPGKQTPLWINPPLVAKDGTLNRFHVLGLGDETHAFHLHGHRWTDDNDWEADIIDVKEITPLQKHSFVIKVSDNEKDNDGAEGWMYHCHFFNHMQAGMSGMLTVVKGDDTLPDVGAVFTISDEPGLWMKTLNAGIADDLDEALAPLNPIFDGAGLPTIDPKPGTGFPLDYLKVLSPEFGDTQGRSLAIINPGETVLFNMKDSQTKHTITTLIYPEEAERIGGNGILRPAFGHFDTQLGIRGSTFLTDSNSKPVGLDTPGLYVFVCKIHPYMFSAVIVDDPTTNVKSGTLGGATLPLLDLVGSPTGELEILTRHIDPITNNTEFPVTLGPVNALPLGLLKTFYVITDPSNWKDYTQDSWTVNLPPALLTTNTEDVVAVLNTDSATWNATATFLDLKKPNGDPHSAYIGANLDSVIDLTSVPNILDDSSDVQGIGEVWVDTQFERTMNKNHLGTPYDKPGTITVVDASNWNVERKISLPEINMNHPHNMWTDAKNEVVYQTQWFDSRMVAIDRDSGEMIKDVFVGQSPSHVMTSPENGKIYIAMNGEEQVTELDPVTFETTKQISTGPRSHPHGHWISSSGDYIVTPNFIGLSASIIDLENETVKNSGLLLGPIATGMMGDESKFYTADFLGNTLSRLDLNANPIGDPINLLEVGAGLPIQTPVSPDDKWMVTANVLGPEGHAITVVDTSVDEIIATLPCDPGCHGVQWGAKDGGGYLAYVSSKFSNALIVVDPEQDPEDMIVGKVILAKKFTTETDDTVIEYPGLGGQGVLAIPNVYEGWIQQTKTACDPDNNGFFELDPCSEDVRGYLNDLESEHFNPLN